MESLQMWENKLKNWRHWCRFFYYPITRK